MGQLEKLAAAATVINLADSIDEASDAYFAVRGLFDSNDPLVLGAAGDVIAAFERRLSEDRRPIEPLVVIR